MLSQRRFNILGCLAIALIAPLVSAASAVRGAETPPAYEAVFADGTRVLGSRITGWGHRSGSPKLDGVRLDDPKRRLRWIRNRGMAPWRMPADCSGYVEFVGGDRLIGRVVGSRPAKTVGGVLVPAHLLVSPARARRHVHSHGPVKPLEPIRVRVETVRRIVMTTAPKGYHRPGRLIRRNGDNVDFVSLRLGDNSISLLLNDSVVEVKLDDAAEIHFPQLDPWETYFAGLGKLSPGCRSTIVRYETRGGAIVTASDLRSFEMPFANDTYKKRALDHLARQDQHIARQENDLKRHEDAIAKARANYINVSARIASETRDARAAGEKALADIKKRIAADKKANPGRSDNERANLAKARARQLSSFEAAQRDKIRGVDNHNAKRLAHAKSLVDRAIGTLERHRQSITRAKERRRISVGVDGDVSTWICAVQPVWCLDIMRIPFKDICMRLSFSPDQVPLSMIRPVAAVSPAMQPWRVDRSLDGRFLSSGRREYCWGFGVHAYSELSFALPRCVNSFQAHLGLDRTVAGGGCAQGRVFLGSTDSKPIYASGMIVGSGAAEATGRIAIRSRNDEPMRLILQADTAHHGRPRGADPLNVRDKLNWYEPVLGFDSEQIGRIVHRHAVRQMPVWDGWDIKFDKSGSHVWATHLWEDSPGARARFLTTVRAEKRPLVLSRQITPGTGDNWLIVDVGKLAGSNVFNRESVSVLVDNKEVKPEPAPVRQEWQKRAPSPTFSLSQFRGKKITVEIRQMAGGPGLYWHKARISGVPPGEYRLAEILTKAGMAGAKIPYWVGWGLQCDAVDQAGQMAMLEIHKAGGVVNFWNPTIRSISENEFRSILIGDGWTGGDKGMATLARIGALKLLLLARDAGVSDAAIEKFRRARPDIKIRMFDHTPSALGGACHVVFKNQTGKDIMLYWVDFEGQYKYPRKLKPNASFHAPSRIWCRYDVRRMDGTKFATYVVEVPPGGKPYVAWDIKDNQPPQK
jgi:hypothetical protein